MIKLTSVAQFCALACFSAATLATEAEGVRLASTATTAARAYASPEQDPAHMRALSDYDALTRKELEAVTRYPNRPEARNQRLQGRVGVAIEVNREGILQDATIIEPSHSRILDAAAMASVHMAKYHAFPADLASEPSRRYFFTFDYRLAPQD